MSIGVVEVTIRIRFDQDITPEEAREFVQEMDYEIKDTTGKVSIVDTEVMETDIPDEDNDLPNIPIEGDGGYASKEDCIASGLHLQDCDEDGYCNNCGFQDTEDEEDRDRRRGTYGPEYDGEKF